MFVATKTRSAFGDADVSIIKISPTNATRGLALLVGLSKKTRTISASMKQTRHPRIRLD